MLLQLSLCPQQSFYLWSYNCSWICPERGEKARFLRSLIVYPSVRMYVHTYIVGYCSHYTMTHLYTIMGNTVTTCKLLQEYLMMSFSLKNLILLLDFTQTKWLLDNTFRFLTSGVSAWDGKNFCRLLWLWQPMLHKTYLKFQIRQDSGISSWNLGNLHKKNSNDIKLSQSHLK